MIQRLIATIALGMMVVCTFAQTTFSKNYFKYTTNSDDSTTVTITEYTRSNTKDVTIDSTVTYSSVTYKITAIGPQAFTNDKVANLVLPATLVEIGDSAFFDCDQLTSVDASACVNLERIGKAVFSSSNAKFTSINLSNCSNLTTIGDSAFAGCTVLATLTGWDDLTNLDTIGFRAFHNCTVLKLALVLPSSIRYLGRAAFYYCKAITSIDMSECTQITEIGYGTFAYCNSDTLLQLPSTITKIGTYAFYKNAFQELDLSHLTKLRFIDNVAFYDCDSLRTITLPANLDSIGYWATFAACGNLQTVYLTNTKAMVKIVDGTDLGTTTIGTYQPFTIPLALNKIYVPKHLRVSYIEDEQWEHL